MKLKFDSLTKVSYDLNEISHLLRKGWIEVQEIIVLPQISPEDERKQLIWRKISEGFLVEPENFTLGLDENDRSAFSQMLGLVKEALDLSLITNDTLQTISDKSGQKHQLTTLRFRQIMVAYGFYFKGLWDELNS